MPATPYIGEIAMVGFNFAPVGWAFCQGQLQSIAQNNALFALVGTTYGGDGVNTFALPNLGGRFATHQGQGPGLQPWVIGQSQGTTSVTLTLSQTPVHTHQASFADLVQFVDEQTSPAPAGTTWPSRLQNGLAYTTNATNASLNAAAVATAGGSQPHDNTMPNLVMPYIIALEGIFPSQN